MKALLLTAALTLAASPGIAADNALVGEWEGDYICAQGATGLTLIVSPIDSTHVSALFRFYAIPTNPDVPDGCYTMDGAFEPGTATVTLIHDKWLLRPPNFVFVDLNGTLDPGGNRITGFVTGPGCSTFHIHRQSTAPTQTPPACHPVIS